VDGKDAFDKFTQAPLYFYDLILMDIQMPNIDGYKATALIRASGRKDCDVPIVAMTANALKEDVDAALKTGMNAHLAKPIDFDLCVRTIKKYCGSKKGDR
jgi:CheY-like chemotaxis protein